MHHFLLTIDVEDWFQVENLKPWIPTSSWNSYELRVEKNVNRILDLLDKKNIHATFFVLGWVAEKVPHLVRQISQRGHEIASHGQNHELCNDLDLSELQNDLTYSKNLLEDITGIEVMGYRAPSFTISQNVLNVLSECGYKYDSSYNSFAMHGRYGKTDFSNYHKKGAAIQLDNGFYELPISNLGLMNKTFPWGGGGYFRIIPFFLFKAGIKKILRQEGDYLFYMHPWEIDPNQPIPRKVSSKNRFKHTYNLSKTETRLENMLDVFKDCKFITCSEYLDF